MRLTPDQRSLIARAIDNVGNKSLVAKVFGVTRKTADKWYKRRKHTKDRRRKKAESKVTLQVELFILALRTLFGWGTERIRKGLLSLPNFMLDTLKSLHVEIIQEFSLSRTSINNVLIKHKLNGYKNEAKSWKFFRAEKADELWQLDIKGPVTLFGRKYYFVICLDDYSRYLILAEQFEHAPTVEEMTRLLDKIFKKRKPEKILTDNNPFKENWDNWCKENGVESIHAHPYYPQDKGKVERNIRNIAEEFIYLLKKFPEWLNGKIKEFVSWFNTKRFHCGIKAIPTQLYT